MTSTDGEKSFDVMRWLRATREQVYEETKDMTFEERREWDSRRSKCAAPQFSSEGVTHAE